MSTDGATRQFELLVADAQRQFEENGKVQNLSFWSYKVMCRAYLPSYQNPPLFPDVQSAGQPQNYIDSGAGYVDYCSWHRYSDFEWLLEQLQYELPGEIFPPLPPKENEATKDKVQDLVSNSQNDNPKLVPFVQSRIRWLNMFFQVLMEMKQVHDNPHLKAFVAMEETPWFKYKEQVKASRHGTGVSAVASKIGSFFSRVTAPKPIVVYDGASEFGRISDTQDRLATHMKLCQYRLKDVENIALNQTKKLSTLSDQMAEDAGKPLPYPAVLNGHFVALGDKVNGVVRHVDQQNYAYVEWIRFDGDGNPTPDGTGLQRVPVTDLQYPSNGISDPVMFAAVEAVTQLESFFAYIQHRSEARDLEQLLDLVTFWRFYCEGIVGTIKRMADVEQRRYNLAMEVQKTSDITKKAAKQDEVDKLRTQHDNAERSFKTTYATLFRPLQRKGLFNVNLLVGKICFNLMNDDDWPNRLARADNALDPNFDVPAEVTRMLEELANGAPPPAAAMSPAPSSTAAMPSSSPAPAPRESSTAITESVASPNQAASPQLATAKPAADSDESSDEDASPAKSEPEAAPSPSPKRAQQQSMFNNSSDDEEET